MGLELSSILQFYIMQKMVDMRSFRRRKKSTIAQINMNYLFDLQNADVSRKKINVIQYLLAVFGLLKNPNMF